MTLESRVPVLPRRGMGVFETQNVISHSSYLGSQDGWQIASFGRSHYPRIHAFCARIFTSRILAPWSPRPFRYEALLHAEFTPFSYPAPRKPSSSRPIIWSEPRSQLISYQFTARSLDHIIITRLS